MDIDRRCGSGLATTYLNVLAHLSDEIGVAAECIARDALGDFELSLWTQEMLCAALKRSLASSEGREMDRKAQESLCKLAAALKGQAQKYEAIIRECSQSRILLRELCHLYGHAHGDSKNTAFPSLSCEV